MGIAFITAKAERYKQRRDAAFEEQLASENLFSAQPENTQWSYRCKSDTEEIPAVGTAVLLYDSGEEIGVFHLNQQIGKVMTPDSTELRKCMRSAKTELLGAKVLEARPV